MFSQGEKCHIEHLVPADTQLPSRQKRSGTNLERITLTKQGAKLSISNFNKTVNMFKSIIFNYKKTKPVTVKRMLVSQLNTFKTGKFREKSVFRLRNGQRNDRIRVSAS